MLSTIFLISISVLTQSVCNSSQLNKLVVPIDWRQFKQTDPSPEFLLSSRIVSNAGRYSYHWANTYYRSTPGDDRFIIKDVNREQPIRTPSSAALGLATALRTGIDPHSMGGSRDEITRTVAKLVKGVVIHHKANGGNWGDHWQSTLWAAQVGRAGWLIWESLDNETGEMLCRVLEYEANRLIQPGYQVSYWNGKGGNSRAEENSWDSMPLQLAIAMMPGHPNVALWKEICSRLLISAYSVPSDMSRKEPELDGRSPVEWLEGYNVREDGIVINHNILHNDYMSSIAHLQMSGFLVFSLAGQPVPQTLDHNFDLIYRTLVTKVFKSPPYQEPGGTMYIPGSPEQYYPEGTDWSKHRYACFYGLDSFVDVLGYDTHLPGASEWRKLRAERILEFQSRHSDGRMYSKGEFDNYWGKEQMVFWMMADAHLLQWLADRDAISEKQNWME